MQTYTVYEKRVASDDMDERATDLVFVREGFTFLALIVPALWFLFHGLWRGLLLYLFLSIGLVAALTELGVSDQIIGFGGFVINLIFAFEARDIQRAALERRGYLLRAVVSGRSLAECEQRFIAEWLPAAKRERERLAAASATGKAGGEGVPPTSVPVIGMFPSHGG
ncbi:MAG TPA: DUF2628 domain-containing protein [Hyphomicrobiales bacterium]|nr:DUF2628 domain-containing protein [Hyphomicrobiales bacterium]